MERERARFSFVISNESSSGPGLHGKPGFVASWRPIHINKPAIRVGGSPFKTFAEAESACKAMLADLTRLLGFTYPLALPRRLRLDVAWAGRCESVLRAGVDNSTNRSRCRAVESLSLSATLRVYHRPARRRIVRGRMAGRDQGADPGRRSWRPDNVRPHRHNALRVFRMGGIGRDYQRCSGWYPSGRRVQHSVYDFRAPLGCTSWTPCARAKKPSPLCPVATSLFRAGASSMSVDNLRPEVARGSR
jgi:hypothetical protein